MPAERAVIATEAAEARPRAGAAGSGVTRGSRVTVALAALLLLLAYVFPLWRYNLAAPQYPEGISMTIWINRLGGHIHLVNQLNHYIGMKVIDPNGFAELRYMPWVVATFCAAGLAAAVIGRFWAVAAWVGTFLGSGIVGLADFYRWLWHFGHELSPDAPIRIDPFTPPLLGPKTVMNFEVVTFPDVGGIAVIVSLLLGVAVLVVEVRRRRRAAA